MKKIFLIISAFVLLTVSLSLAGDKQPLPKEIPTEFGEDVKARYYEINSVQTFDLDKDTVKVRFILALYADTVATKELGFGQYEVKISGANKTAFQNLVFPLLNQELNKE